MPRSNTKQPSDVHYHDVEQGSEEWHAGRASKISGSTAHKLLGKGVPSLNSFNQESTFTGNFATKRGHLLETEALELYEAIHNVKVQHAGYVTNDNYPNCIYSPDGYLDDRTIEVKCFLPANHLATLKRRDIKILAQCHFGQLILDKDLTDLVLYCPKDEIPLEQKYVEIQIEKNERIRNNMKDKIARVR